MKHVVCIGVLLACTAALAGCESSELTELLVVVDSDLAVPGELDAVRVEVSGATAMSATGSLATSPLPRTVGIVHRGGGLGPVEVIAIGTRGGTEVVRARAITSFVRGQTLILPMLLSRRCTGVPCGAGQTCSAGSCVSADVDPASLEGWSGTVPRLDGGACPILEERCNGEDDDCDGRIDEIYDLQTDPVNCGACGTRCAVPNATTACSAGACTISACSAGFGDCDGDRANGCEVDVTSDPAHCSGCGMACSFANAMASCTASTCAMGACLPGFADCDADPANGCERATTTLTDCGGCDVACSVAGGTATCASGTCAVDTCDVGLGDCDMDAANGCELPLDTLSDCGACGTACDLAHATDTCATRACAIASCDAGFADCDTMSANGCERPTTTLTDCGACGVPCALANATETCATGSCAVATCNAGFGDCDGMAANGCETDLRRNDLHCDMCGNACAPGTTCRTTGGCR